MACPELSMATSYMSQNMRNQLGGYQLSLQCRYGDPRIYAQQEQQMAKDRAAVAYNKAQHVSKLLEDSYKRQTERNRELHAKRINNRNGQKSSSPPESQPQTQRSRKKRQKQPA